jgi:glutaminyl-tRNA synthetase
MLGPRIRARPAVTSAQLVGRKCVRFEGLWVAYFAMDNKDARIACLDKGGDVSPGRRQGDYLVLKRIVGVSLRKTQVSVRERLSK